MPLIRPLCIIIIVFVFAVFVVVVIVVVIAVVVVNCHGGKFVFCVEQRLASSHHCASLGHASTPP